MNQEQAERVAGTLLSADSSAFQIRILQRSAKKGHYVVLYTQPMSWFPGGHSDASFQANYNACRADLVKRLVSMDVVAGSKSPHLRWSVA